VRPKTSGSGPHRRAVLAGTAAAVAMTAVKASAAGDLGALLAVFGQERLNNSPETVTSLGLDTGAEAWAKHRLDDRSLAARQRDKALTTSQLVRLKALDRTSLIGLDAVSYDTEAYLMETDAGIGRLVNYGDVGDDGPYVLSQQTGDYCSTPDFLESQHSIATKDDAEAYLDRLDGFAIALDQEQERLVHDVAAGAIPPDFILVQALRSLAELRDTPASGSSLVSSVADRAKAAGIEGDYAGRATKIYQDRVVPALSRQIEALGALKSRAVHDAGVWRLPEGGAYYEAMLRRKTTTTLSSDEVNQRGLDLVGDLSGQLDARLKAQGMSQGTVGQRLRALFGDPAQRYANTDAGKAQLIADLNVKVRQIQAKLPQYFNTLPKATVEIKRVPPYTEANQATGYYQAGSLDGSRPGAYYINLRDTAELPRWTLPTLTFHESIPGHHLQLSLQQEANLPLVRKIDWFDAYGEGWALYAEQLAGEMGMYEDDPLGRIGYLHDALFRAARLVMDTGLHAKRWSREQAIGYYTGLLGDPDSAAATEVDRYCVSPGQACSYMIGKLTWLRLRQQARTALGARFDIRTFHDAGLLPGAMPLTVLEAAIQDYVRAAKA
jgi:uncharacterized protein (DUF885 family)